MVVRAIELVYWDTGSPKRSKNTGSYQLVGLDLIYLLVAFYPADD